MGIHPLDLSRLSWNDFVANAVFFVVDVSLFSILFPLLLKFADRRKWSNARYRIGERSAFYLSMIEFHFDQLARDVVGQREVLPQAFEGKPEAWTEEGLIKQKLIVFRALEEGTKKLGEALEQATDLYLQEMQLLAPAFNSDLAISVVDFYQKTIWPKSIPMARLFFWCACGPEQLPPTADHPPEPEFLGVEAALETLCKATRIKTRRDQSGRLVVPRRSQLHPGTLPNEYPGHPRIFESMATIHKALGLPLDSQQVSSI